MTQKAPSFWTQPRKNFSPPRKMGKKTQTGGWGARPKRKNRESKKGFCLDPWTSKKQNANPKKKKNQKPPTPPSKLPKITTHQATLPKGVAGVKRKKEKQTNQPPERGKYKCCENLEGFLGGCGGPGAPPDNCFPNTELFFPPNNTKRWPGLGGGGGCASPSKTPGPQNSLNRFFLCGWVNGGKNYRGSPPCFTPSRESAPFRVSVGGKRFPNKPGGGCVGWVALGLVLSFNTKNTVLTRVVNGKMAPKKRIGWVQKIDVCWCLRPGENTNKKLG